MYFLQRNDHCDGHLFHPVVRCLLAPLCTVRVWNMCICHSLCLLDHSEEIHQEGIELEHVVSASILAISCGLR